MMAGENTLPPPGLSTAIVILIYNCLPQELKGGNLGPGLLANALKTLCAKIWSAREEKERCTGPTRYCAFGTAAGLTTSSASSWSSFLSRNVKGDDIKKHRNDVFRLYLSLAPSDRFALPEQLGADLELFLSRHPPELPEWLAIRQAVGIDSMPEPGVVLEQIRAIFAL
jgi:hypothetical protein